MARGTTPKRRKIVLDLNSKIIGPDAGAYVVFPGEDHAFYEAFQQQQAVFLDTPALELPPHPIDENSPDLLQRLMVSRSVRAWHLAQNGSASKKQAPSRILADYNGYKWTRPRLVYRTALIGLLGEAKKGDVVVVPGPGYWSDVLIGELIGGPTDQVGVQVPERYGKDLIPARRVKWLARRRKGALSSALIDRLQSPNPIFLLDRSLRPEVYNLAYGTYSVAADFAAQFRVTENEFTFG
jgi:hypothetical protein